MKNYKLTFTILIISLLSAINASFANDPFLSHFVPATLDETYKGEEIIPQLSNSNANSMFCLQYKQNEEVLATLLATRTFEDIHNQASKIDYRYGDAELIALYTLELNNYQFTIGMFNTSSGGVFYNCNYALEYQNPANFNLINTWNETAVKDNHSVLNYDITALSESAIISFIEAMISKIQKESEIIQNSNYSLPKTYIKRIDYKNGNTVIELANASDNKTFEIKVSKSKIEQGEWNDNYSEIIEIQKDQTDINIPGFWQEGTIELWQDGKMVDKVFQNDGVWNIKNEEELFYSKIEAQEQIIENAYQIERSVIAVSKLLNPVLLSRTILIDSKELLDYNFISFEIEGIKAITIDIIDINDFKFSSTKTKLEDGQLDFELKDFIDQNNKPFGFSSIKELQFRIDGQKQAYPMKIEKLRFASQIALNNKNEDYNNIEISVFPNPTSDFINIKCKEEQIDQATIFNCHGNAILKTNSTENIDLRNLAKGTYTIQIKTKNQLKNKKILVL